MRRRLLGPDHPDVGTSLVHLAILEVARGEYETALASAGRSVEILSKGLSPGHWKTAVGESALGAALAGRGRRSEGEAHLGHSLAILTKDGGAPPEYARLAQRYLDGLRARRAGGAGGGGRAERRRRGPLTVPSQPAGHNARPRRAVAVAARLVLV